MIGNQDIDELSVECPADRIQLAFATRNTHDSLDVFQLVQADADNTLVEWQVDWLTCDIEETQADITYGAGLLQGFQFFFWKDIATALEQFWGFW